MLSYEGNRNEQKGMGTGPRGIVRTRLRETQHPGWALFTVDEVEELPLDFFLLELA